MMRQAKALLLRDLRGHARSGGDLLAPPAFFAVVCGFVPLAVGGEPALLGRIGPGIIWLAALLAALLSLDRLFATEAEDGALDQMRLGSLPLPFAFLIRLLGQWLATGLPLVVLSPILALLLGLPVASWSILALSLLIGTPALFLLGGVGAALLVGARRGGVLLPLLILPLQVPILIFGAAAVQATTDGQSASGPLMVLAAFLLASLPGCAWAGAAALDGAG